MPRPIQFDPFAPEVLERGPKALSDVALAQKTCHYRGRFEARRSPDFNIRGRNSLPVAW